MRTLKIVLLLFSMLLDCRAIAQDKSVSIERKDSIQETKSTPIFNGPQTQSTKVIICGPSRSSLIELLYIVNGKIKDYAKFSKIKPNSIKSMEVLYPKEAQLIYGDKGANGAIIITTK